MRASERRETVQLHVRNGQTGPLPAGQKVADEIPVTYDSDDGTSPVFRELRELVRFRSLLWLMTINQFRSRYRRSSIGMVWVIIQPLLSTAVLTIAFSTVSKAKIPNYPLYAMTGLLAWNLFLQATTTGINATVTSGTLCNRIYVPRSLYVVVAAGNGVVNLTLGLLPLLVLMLFLRAPVPLTWVLMPVAAALVVAFSVGIGLLVSTLAVFVNDMAHVYSVLVPLLFFVTPVAYPIEFVSPGLTWIIRLNPMYYMCSLFRALLFEGRVPDSSSLLTAAIASLVSLSLGWWIFSKNSDRFAYYV